MLHHFLLWKPNELAWLLLNWVIIAHQVHCQSLRNRLSGTIPPAPPGGSQMTFLRHKAGHVSSWAPSGSPRPNSSCTGLLRSSIHWLQPSPRFTSQRLSGVSDSPFRNKLVLEPSTILNQLCLYQKQLPTSGASATHRLQFIIKPCLRPHLLGQALPSSPGNVFSSLLCPKALFLNTRLHHLTCYITSAAATAKLLQSCPTLCDPIDGSPPGSPIPGILQARTLEWVAISSSSAWKWKVKVKSLSRVWLLTTPWTAAHQAPPSMGFSRQEYWSGVPLPSLYITSTYLLLTYYISF